LKFPRSEDFKIPHNPTNHGSDNSMVPLQ